MGGNSQTKNADTNQPRKNTFFCDERIKLKKQKDENEYRNRIPENMFEVAVQERGEENPLQPVRIQRDNGSAAAIKQAKILQEESQPHCRNHYGSVNYRFVIEGFF